MQTTRQGSRQAEDDNRRSEIVIDGQTVSKNTASAADIKAKIGSDIDKSQVHQVTKH